MNLRRSSALQFNWARNSLNDIPLNIDFRIGFLAFICRCFMKKGGSRFGCFFKHFSSEDCFEGANKMLQRYFITVH